MRFTWFQHIEMQKTRLTGHNMTQCMLQMSSFKNHSPVVDVWFVLYLAFGVQGWSMNWESPWARCLPHSICLRVCELGNQWKSAVWRGKYQVSHQSEAIHTIAHSPAKVSEDISLITSGFWTVESRLGARGFRKNFMPSQGATNPISQPHDSYCCLYIPSH